MMKSLVLATCFAVALGRPQPAALKGSAALATRVEVNASTPALGNICDCDVDTCKCCAHIESDHIVVFNDTLCVEADYNRQSGDIDLEFLLNGHVEYEHDFNAHNLTDFCFNLGI